MEIINKGWGYEKIIVNSDYCGKILHFNKDKRCSWHFHSIKRENFYCAQGKFIIKWGYGDDINQANEMILTPGMTFDVPVGLRHQMIALEEDSELFEVSTHDEYSDSLRIIKGD